MKLLNSYNNKRFFTKHGFKLAMLLAVLFLLFVISIVSLKAREQFLVKRSNYAPQTIKQVSSANQKKYHINDIISANLFGSPEKLVSAVPKKAPKTKLNLTLQGILFTRDENIARAIIVSGNKSSQLYSVGDKIKGSSVEIKEIRNAEVIINRNGVLESLPLVKKTNSGDNQIFVFSNSEPGQNASSNDFASSQSGSGFESIQTSSIRNADSQPRKIRKPNFSGLDRKLKSMGEL